MSAVGNLQRVAVSSQAGLRAIALCLALAPALASGAALSQAAEQSRTAERAGLTGKERLGGKSSDRQRVDDCKVPVERREGRQRPSSCAHVRPERAPPSGRSARP